MTTKIEESKSELEEKNKKDLVSKILEKKKLIGEKTISQFNKIDSFGRLMGLTENEIRIQQANIQLGFESQKDFDKHISVKTRYDPENYLKTYRTSTGRDMITLKAFNNSSEPLYYKYFDELLFKMSKKDVLVNKIYKKNLLEKDRSIKNFKNFLLKKRFFDSTVNYSIYSNGTFFNDLKNFYIREIQTNILYPILTRTMTEDNYYDYLNGKKPILELNKEGYGDFTLSKIINKLEEYEVFSREDNEEEILNACKKIKTKYSL